MKIPDKVKVGGKDYKIVWNDELLTNEGFNGLACHRELIIYLCKIYRGDKLAKSNIEEVFLHEIIHAVDTVYNNHSLDEDTVDRLSQGLYQVLKDNFKL